MAREFDVVFIGRFFLPAGPENCCVGVSDGRIVKIAKQLAADYTLDFGHYLVLPGAVDSHVHLRDPGLTHKEDVKTGSTAAIYGGVTSVVEMPNTVPPVKTLSHVRAKWEALRDRSLVDVGLMCQATLDTDFERAMTMAVGFKVYLGPTTGERGFERLEQATEVLRSAVSTTRPVSVHAEDPILISNAQAGPSNLAEHNAMRPPAAEASAIRWLSETVDTTKVTVCHLSSAAGLNEAQDCGFRGALETSPHHALLDIGVSGLSTPSHAKVNPPLREKADREAIFAALRAGRIPILASDHAPHTAAEKNEAFPQAPCGVPGVETMLPLMMGLSFNRQIETQRVVDSCCRLPAERFGLKKGKIAPGYDADFAVFDPRDIKRIRPEHLHSKCGWTPFAGMFAVMPVAVFLRGDEIMADGQIRPSRPPGQLLRPPGPARHAEPEERPVVASDEQ